ncbi:unnamed protein product [Linum trigynum]|uniref:Polyprotein n=1 Tax=Linum trigynum TaxID=586398 RepID=A0AAV2CXG5_9ROSI
MDSISVDREEGLAMVEAIEQGNLFCTRCLIKEELFLVLVDGGIKSNLVSSRTVTKLGLPMRLHPSPGMLQFPGKKISSIVVGHASVKFSIGRYEDIVLCDVVSNLTNQIVLGQTWFQDRGVHMVSRRSKSFRLRHQNKVFILKPLSLEEAVDEWKVLKRLQQEYEEEALTQLAAQMTQVEAMLKTMAEQTSRSSSLVQESSSSEEVNIEVEDELKEATDSYNFLEGNGVVSQTSGTSEQQKEATDSYNFLEGNGVVSQTSGTSEQQKEEEDFSETVAEKKEQMIYCDPFYDYYDDDLSCRSLQVLKPSLPSMKIKTRSWIS